MSYSKKAISLALAAAMLAQPVFSASAEETDSSLSQIDVNFYTDGSEPEDSLSSEDDSEESNDSGDSRDSSSDISESGEDASDFTDVQLTEDEEAVFEEGSVNDTDDQLADYVFEGDTVPCSENDPSYHKFVNNQAKTRAVWGSANLVHQQRFSKHEKVYGIDVSYYQQAIDWNKVKAAGIEYAIIRVGYRGYGNGRLVLDDNFSTYIKGAKAAGLDVGVYFYTQAINTAEAKEEAEFVLKYISSYDLELPVYYDIEGVDYDTGRLDAANLSKAQKTALCTAFADTIKKAGYEAGIYANMSWLTYQIDGESLGKTYPIWLAHYTTNTDYSGEFNMWQYTGTGSVNGIGSTYVDMNVLYDDGSSDTVTEPADAPKNIQVKGSVSDAVRIGWDKVSGATGYYVYIYDYSSGALKKQYTASTNEYRISGLSANTFYKVKVRASFSGKLGSESSSYTISTKPSTPTGLKASSKTETSITLKWNAVSGTSFYRIYMYNNDTAAYTKKLDVYDATTCKITGLTEGARYRFKIAAVRTTDLKNYLSERSSNISVATSGAQYYAKTPYTGSSLIQGFADIGITADYSFREGVALINGIGNYTGTAAQNTQMLNLLKTGKLLKPVYQAPTGIRVVSYVDNGVRVRWNAVPGATSYYAYIYDTANKKYTRVAEVTDTEYRFSNLEGNTSYKIKIKSVYGKEAGIASSVYTINTRPDTPTGLKASSKTETSVTLKWNAVSGTDFYRIYMYSNDTGEYVKKLDVYGATSCKITGLSKGSRYRFKVGAARTTSIKNYVSAKSGNISVATSGVKYYKKTSYTGGSLYYGLADIGVTSSYSLQERIAEANGVGNYTGTAAQNTQMLDLLKAGKLIIPQ